MNEILKKIQSKIGAKPDGHFGPKTAFALGKYLGMSLAEAANFVGQCAVETGWFTTFVERFNYTSAQLQNMFSAFRDPLVAAKYVGNHQAIANRAYANRVGNGDEASGDGWRFRGRGLIQTTGRANYQALARSMRDDRIMSNPDIVAEEIALESAVHFWKKRNIGSLCTSTSMSVCTAVTFAVNGPARLHLKERHRATLRVEKWLKDLNY